jgi:hypothetical protein
MNPFRRKKIQHGTPDLYYYTHGDVFTPGAENLAYETNLLHPLQGIGGIGVKRSLRPIQPPQLYQSIALPTQALLSGVQAGQLVTQPLTEDPNSGNGYN